MNARDLLNAWEKAVDATATLPPRADELDELLDARTGLRAGRMGTYRMEQPAVTNPFVCPSEGQSTWTYYPYRA